jgi:hypothetical protein
MLVEGEEAALETTRVFFTHPISSAAAFNFN